MPLRVVPRRDRKLNRFVKAAETRDLRRGETLWSPGEPARHLVLVRMGHLRLVDPGPPARDERTVAVAGPWELAGEGALAEGGVRHLGAVAGERSAIQLLGADDVRSVLRASPRTLASFLEALRRDLSLARTLAAGSGGPPAAARLAAVLVDLAERLGRGGEEGEIPMRPTHRTLADLAGVHRSTVTTILNEWLYEGLLGDPGGGLRLAEPGTLRGLASSWTRPRKARHGAR